MDDYLAHREPRVVPTEQERIEAHVCSPALAHRHSQADRHRRQAQTRLSAALDDPHTVHSSYLLADTPGSQIIDDLHGMLEVFPDSGYEAGAASRADQMGELPTKSLPLVVC
ncbi:BQ5605_C005g03452 [Microbotryum silenes-dioicae]|uniref:BQ5605_C005g03452 protein n=1 Tax=Microbotryum silenes-dioicae TaxID=796604 RepID=A0A2X0MAW8_9BASI|nr:BQ5605_C005g03452 [Microbotryum silenes-dioicae]